MASLFKEKSATFAQTRLATMRDLEEMEKKFIKMLENYERKKGGRRTRRGGQKKGGVHLKQVHNSMFLLEVHHHPYLGHRNYQHNHSHQKQVFRIDCKVLYW